MQQRPEPPPEGRLIADATDRLGISIREAARRAGLSYGRWRQITQGYQNVSPGEYAKVHAPARTLAKMAAVAGVTPEQMETEGQRPDAAAEMRNSATAAPAAVVPLHQDPPPDRLLPAANSGFTDEELAPYIQRVRDHLADVMREHGPGATAEQIFATPYEQAVWTARRFNPAEKEHAIAAVWKTLDDAVSEGGRHRAVLVPP